MALTLLLLSILLGFVHIFAAIGAETKERGADWNAGPRDGDAPDLPPVVGRLKRAQANYMETWPFFAALMLAVMIRGSGGALATSGGLLYLLTRAAYLPLYARGVPKIRSYAYLVSLIGIALVALAALLS
ncbi:MAPEG family protein [Pseudooceanicola sp. C21-150M6]|uniref:MAPEG family protein n=1 Tax=Pseudooceanicola sp. C21-150M6 TaxID=3434355 RepID=UPI003D7FFE1C